jgi:hypothetical protein
VALRWSLYIGIENFDMGYADFDFESAYEQLSDVWKDVEQTVLVDIEEELKIKTVLTDENSTEYTLSYR